MLNERPGVGAQPRNKIRIFKKIIRGLRKEPPQESCFPRAPRPGQDHRAEMTGRTQQLGGQSFGE